MGDAVRTHIISKSMDGFVIHISFTIHVLTAVNETYNIKTAMKKNVENLCARYFFSFCFSALRYTRELADTDGQRKIVRFIWLYRQITMIMHILYTGSNSFMGAKCQ